MAGCQAICEGEDKGSRERSLVMGAPEVMNFGRCYRGKHDTDETEATDGHDTDGPRRG